MFGQGGDDYEEKMHSSFLEKMLYGLLEKLSYGAGEKMLYGVLVTLTIRFRYQLKMRFRCIAEWACWSCEVAATDAGSEKKPCGEHVRRVMPLTGLALMGLILPCEAVDDEEDREGTTFSTFMLCYTIAVVMITILVQWGLKKIGGKMAWAGLAFASFALPLEVRNWRKSGRGSLRLWLGGTARDGLSIAILFDFDAGV